jgi:hypothetical protein
MVNDSKSDISNGKEPKKTNSSNWFKIALLTAGSALAGGVAAAWWYRKTLIKLRETGENAGNPYFGIPVDRSQDGSEDDI